jgi:hypothetical protein
VRLKQSDDVVAAQVRRLRRRGWAASHRFLEGVVIHQPERLTHPFRQGAAFQQAVLSLEKLLIPIVAWGDVLAADDLFRLAINAPSSPSTSRPPWNAQARLLDRVSGR